MVLTTYASVFILLALLLVQFAPLGAEAATRGYRTTNTLALALFIFFIGTGCGGLSAFATPDWLALSILWQDLTFVATEYSYASLVMHELLYRLFM